MRPLLEANVHLELSPVCLWGIGFLARHENVLCQKASRRKSREILPRVRDVPDCEAVG